MAYLLIVLGFILGVFGICILPTPVVMTVCGLICFIIGNGMIQTGLEDL